MNAINYCYGTKFDEINVDKLISHEAHICIGRGFRRRVNEKFFDLRSPSAEFAQSVKEFHPFSFFEEVAWLTAVFKVEKEDENLFRFQFHRLCVQM